MKADSSEKTILHEDYLITYIQVIGDWIYFKTDDGRFSRIRTDGSELSTIIDKGAHNPQVLDGYVYDVEYVNADASTKVATIYKADVNGQNKEVIFNGKGNFYKDDNQLDIILVDEEGIYFREYG